MYIDICYSQDQVEFAKEYHSQKGHKQINVTKQASEQVVVSVLEGQTPNFERTGKYYEPGPGLWVVTAHD